MTLSAFVPSGTPVYTGLRVPEKVTKVETADMDALVGHGNWRFAEVEKTHLAEHRAPLHIEVDQPWGPSQAHAGDYIIRGPQGVSIVPFVSFRSLRMTEIKE